MSNLSTPQPGGSVFSIQRTMRMLGAGQWLVLATLCVEALSQDPQSTIEPPSSTTPSSSPPSNTSSQESPEDDCKCGENSRCVRNTPPTKSQCLCLGGYEGPPPNCRPGAQLLEVCYKGSPCGVGSECEMDEEGRRYCRCAEGYFGCPPNCQLGPRLAAECGGCGPDAECDPKREPRCRCVPGFEGEPPNCMAGPELLKNCDPYPCGGYSSCSRQGGLAVCYCLDGFQGVAPHCRPGQEMFRVCVKDRPCGWNANCTVVDGMHKCSSACFEGFTGTPPDCTKVKKQEEATTNSTYK